MGKGASELDKAAHRVFGFAGDKRDNGWHDTGAYCVRCGFSLESSYCEERLYMVRCRKCETVTLVEGSSPIGAAETLGIVALPAEDWHEDYGDCLWWEFPIEEPPYCGSPLASDWPGYHTHFTRFTCPEEPELKGGEG